MKSFSLSFSLSAPALGIAQLQACKDDHGCTVSVDGHLERNGERYRLFGTNLTFDECVLPHEDADVLAARLAKVGFNAVRFHLCDSFFDWPRIKYLIDYSDNNSGKFVEENLDRYFYMIDALKRNGIYVDVNLLTARRFPPGDSGDPDAPLPLAPITDGEIWTTDSMHHDKVIGFFYDPVFEAEQRFAEELLTRPNPYTGLTLAEDPAVGIVELVNESGLVHYWMSGRLDDVEAPLLFELQTTLPSSTRPRWKVSNSPQPARVGRSTSPSMMSCCSHPSSNL
jgi:hypothetical protein